jgi:hypothetical protein
VWYSPEDQYSLKAHQTAICKNLDSFFFCVYYDLDDHIVIVIDRMLQHLVLASFTINTTCRPHMKHQGCFKRDLKSKYSRCRKSAMREREYLCRELT